MYVVAGASGRVGSAVARELLSTNQAVTVLLRNGAHGAQWEQRGARVRIGVLEDTDFLAKALDGASAVFLLQPPSYDQPDFLARQAALAANVERAVRASGAHHVVLLSSVGAHLERGTGPIQGLYGWEAALRRSGVTLSAYRSSYFQDNVRNVLNLARQGLFPTFAPDPEQPFPQISCIDVGAAIARAMQAGPPAASEVVDLVGPAYSHVEVAASLSKALGRELKVAPVPRPAWVPALQKSGMSQEICELFCEMYDALSAGRLVGVAERRLEGTTPMEVTIERLVSASGPG